MNRRRVVGFPLRRLVLICVLSLILFSSALSVIHPLGESAQSSSKVNHDGVSFIGVGSSPVGIAADSANGYLYVANNGSNSISVINPKTNTLVTTIPSDLCVGTYPQYFCTNFVNPEWVAYDAANEMIYVTNYDASYGYGFVSVLNSTNDPVATIYLGHFNGALNSFNHLRGIGYDPANQEIYVSDTGGVVYEISSSQNVVVGATVVGNSNDNVFAGFPVVSGVSYNPANKEMYVSNDYLVSGYDVGNVSVISSVSNQVVTTINSDQNGNPLYGPTGIAYDPNDQDMHVAIVDVPYKNGIEIDSATNQVVTSYNTSLTSTGSFSIGVTFDPSDDSMYYAHTPSVFGFPNSVGVTNVSSDSTVAEISNQTYYPFGIIYSPVSREIYVTNAGSSTVTIIGGRSYNIVATVSLVFNGPTAAVYSPNGNNIFFSELCCNNVFEVNGKSLAVSVVPLSFDSPAGLASDLSNGNLYIANNGNNTVIVVNPLSYTVIADISVADPYKLAYDSATGNIYATGNIASGIVTEISGATNTVINTISGFNSPLAITFDKTNGDLYVVNSNSTISVVSGKTNRVVGAPIALPIPVNSPFARYWNLAYDGSNGDVYVTTQGGLFVINSKTNVLSGLIGNYEGRLLGGGLAYDSQDGDLFISSDSSISSNSLWAIDGGDNLVATTVIPPFGSFNSLVFDNAKNVMVDIGFPTPSDFGTVIAIAS